MTKEAEIGRERERVVEVFLRKEWRVTDSFSKLNAAEVTVGGASLVTAP